MSEIRPDSPTLRLRRLDAATHELTELVREGRISTLFQPIVDPRSRGICGFEALTRGPSDSWLHSPQNLFEAARKSGVKLQLDFLCIQSAFKRFAASRVAGPAVRQRFARTPSTRSRTSPCASSNTPRRRACRPTAA